MKSSSKREAFFKVFSALEMKNRKPLKRPDYKWMYVLNVLYEIKELWDSLVLYGI